MTKPTEDWLVIGVISFCAGIVANIIVPTRRGIFGFLSAAIVGVFCGGVAGMIAQAYDVHVGMQYAVCATVGVMGDRILSFIMKWRQETASTTINVTGGKNTNHFGKGNQNESNK